MAQPPRKPTTPTVNVPATAPTPAGEQKPIGPPNPALKPDLDSIERLSAISKKPGLDGRKNFKSAVKLVLKMVERNEEEAFPPDIDAKRMVMHLIDHGDSQLAKESKGKEAGAAAVTENTRRREVRKALTRLEEIVDPRFPHTNPARASFFPATPGEHTEIERLSSMVNGINKHGIGIMPTEYPLEVLTELLGGGAAAKGDLDDAEESVATTEVQQSLHTRESRKRLARIVRGIHGDGNPLLLDYGISPRVKSARGRSPSRAAPTPAKLQKQEAKLQKQVAKLQKQQAKVAIGRKQLESEMALQQSKLTAEQEKLSQQLAAGDEKTRGEGGGK